jgi:receptor protein-tyrosine kinase
MLITNKKTGFVFNETYKSMRTKIERFSKKHSSKAILVSSALENEGKTTVAVNIALTLAQNGNKVIIIDCDLRKPAVATVLEVKDQIKVSMIDVIEKKSSVGQAVISLPKLNIDLIGGSKSVSNSSEVLSTKGLSDALDTLRASYDYIIIDTPPSQLFTDAVIMTEVADATVIVVKQDSANIDDVVNIVSDFGQSKAELIGFVFNNVRSASVLPAGYSKKYNYSYYGYGKK